MIIDEFKESLATYERMLQEREFHPLALLNVVDRRLAEISNHIAICHRFLAEQRALAHAAFWSGTRRTHFAKAEQAEQTLEQVIVVQGEFYSFRWSVLRSVAVLIEKSNGASDLADGVFC